MKRALQIAAYSCGGVMGIAAGLYSAGWCGGMTATLAVLAAALALAVCKYELAIIRKHEQRAAEAARRSAYREAFFRELREDRP